MENREEHRMTDKEAAKTIENAKKFAYDDCYEEAFDIAIEAIDVMSHITDRPCEACDCNKGGACTIFGCVFDKYLTTRKKEQ